MGRSIQKENQYMLNPERGRTGALAVILPPVFRLWQSSTERKFFVSVFGERSE
jgi:hypothetical protein